MRRQFLKLLKSVEVEKELENAVKNNIQIILYNDKNYPKPLKNLTDKPLVLYIKVAF
jgi:predicted Rossmann fold nucleotide-binding protein DprA/Smf involved in DNA uptake